jgi:hypothetical protein
MSMLKACCHDCSPGAVASALTLAIAMSSPPKAPGGVVDPGLQGGPVADIERAPEHLNAAPGQCLAGGLDLGRVARAEGDVTAFGSERLDDRASDAFGAAGDDGAFVGESQVHVLPPKGWRGGGCSPLDE